MTIVLDTADVDSAAENVVQTTWSDISPVRIRMEQVCILYNGTAQSDYLRYCLASNLLYDQKIFLLSFRLLWYSWYRSP